MSQHVIGLYLQGAIIHDEDFDPGKTVVCIAKYLENALPNPLSEKILSGTELEQTELKEICEAVDVDPATVKNVSDISKELLRHKSELFDEDSKSPLPGDSQIQIEYISGMDNMVFRWDNPQFGEAELYNCLVIGLSAPKVWTLDQYNGFVGRDAVIARLREFGAPMLKDDVPWDDRLGEVIATTAG